MNLHTATAPHPAFGRRTPGSDLRNDSRGVRRAGARPAAAPALALALAGLLLSPCVRAQTPPGAGSVQRDVERSLQAPPSAPAAPAAPTLAPMPPEGAEVRLTVRQIDIEGARLLPVAELHALVASAIGRSLTLGELEHLAQRIAEHYREQGWYARVYLPEQDVTSGRVRIEVLEGHYGGSSLESDAQRADAAGVQAIVSHRLRPGAPLSAADLERGLLLANDLPGVRAEASLGPGSQRGETRLALRVQDTPLLSGDLGINNAGSRYTGRAQLVGGLALNGPSGIGDQFNIRLLGAERLYGLSAGYSLPLGRDGLRLGAYASTLGYKLGHPYSALDAKGEAQTGGINLSYPLIRQSARNLRISAGYQHRRYADDLLKQALHRQRIDVALLGLGGDLRDSLGGGGFSWGGLQLSDGRLAIRNVAGDRAMDALTARSHGRYDKLTWNLARLQELGSGWQLQGQLIGQWARDNLASAERFSLGGPGGVRAYPVNEASGDQGMLMQLELRKHLGSGWQALAFYDAGRIRQHKHPWAGWDAGGKQPNSYTLQGFGVGVGWRTPAWLFDASIARPIGHNRGADARGRNNDGSRQHGARAWLSLTRLF